MSTINPRVPNRQGESKYAVVGNTETGITAHAGGGQTNAYALTAQLSVVATSASDGDSVHLPGITSTPAILGSPNSMMIVSNQGASSVQVYGASPDTIDGAATGTGVTLPAGATASFFVTASNEWVSTIPASSGGGMAIGGAVTGGTDNSILFVNDGDLSQSANLIFDQFSATGFAVGAGVRAAQGPSSINEYAEFLLCSGGPVNEAYVDLEASQSDGYASMNLRVLATNYKWTATSGQIALSVDGGDELIAKTTGITIPSLAGVGTRNVVVDANGVLSAP